MTQIQERGYEPTYYPSRDREGAENSKDEQLFRSLTVAARIALCAFPHQQFGVCYFFVLLKKGLNMLPTKCNIDNTDRINRTIIGIVLCLAVLIGMSASFYFIVGVILIVEGLIGWCSIPIMVEKWKNKQNKQNK